MTRSSASHLRPLFLVSPWLGQQEGGLWTVGEKRLIPLTRPHQNVRKEVKQNRVMEQLPRGEVLAKHAEEMEDGWSVWGVEKPGSDYLKLCIFFFSVI
ncbi:hypothetical protein BaRGS_00035314, partial [Batillaria attramentaria]